MQELFADKQALRSRCSALRGGFSPQERAAMDASLCERIAALPGFRQADTVLLYAPIKSEPNLLSVACTALALGKRVAFPRCVTDSHTLRFFTVSSPDRLTPGAFSIAEPSEDCEELACEETGNALCVVPALAYDRKGFRLGYGKGYYDRYLPHFRGTSVGAVYSPLLLNELPTEPTDRGVEWVITEKEVLQVHG